MDDALLIPIKNWFARKGWTPWPFQEEAWKKALQGKSGLISVPTGAGKTYAAFLGPLADIHANHAEGLQILYLTPLKSLARDLEQALRSPIQDFRMGSYSRKPFRRHSGKPESRQKKRCPPILLTTPESLSILQTDPNQGAFFSNLKYVIVDEWHELCGTKRGALLELSLAHLRSFLPHLRIWVLSATLGNPNITALAALGKDSHPEMIEAALSRPVIVESILPSTVFKFPWAGFLGIQMLF